MQKQEKQKEQRKILYIITKSSWGGAQRYVYDLAEHFNEKNGVSVAFGKNEFGGDNIFENKLQEKNIRSIELKEIERDIKILGDIKGFFALIKLLRKEKPDIVHLNSSKIGGLGALAARISRIEKIIFTTHGLPFLEKRDFIAHNAVKIFSLLTVALSTNTICVSKCEYRKLTKYKLFRKKIHKIYNGIKKPDFLSREQARTELAEKFNIPIKDDTYIIGSIAELTHTKGLMKFLKKLRKRKNKGRKFMYIHFGTGELADKLREKTHKLELTKNVFWLGFVPNASKYLKALDLFTLPSRKEGLPYVLLEAKMAGIKIKANKVGGVEEILDNPVSEFEISKMLEKTEVVYNK